MTAAPIATACPICGSSDRVPYYDRPEATCAGCGSLERQRALARELRAELLPRGGGGRCLEIAPYNPRVLSAFLQPLGWEYESLDKRLVRGPRDPGVFDSYITYDRDLADLYGIASGRYELVTLQHVLSEVVDDRAALDEIARVLEPGGRALLEIPWSPKAERTALVDRDANRYGNRREYGGDVVDELFARFADVEQHTLREGLYTGTVFVCRARGGPAARRTPPVVTGSIAPGVPLYPVAAPAGRDAETVELPVFGLEGPADLAERYRELRTRHARYTVRPVGPISVPRASLVGPHLVAVQDGRTIEGTIQGARSFGDRRVFARGAEGWPALTTAATQRTIAEPVAAVGVRAPASYLHWVTEVLPRLVALEEFEDARGLPLLMRPAELPFHAETLEQLGLHPRWVTEDVVHVAHAVIPSLPVHPRGGGRFSPDVVRLARRFRDRYVRTPTGVPPRRLYVPDTDAAEPEPILEELGFEAFVPAALTVAEQIAAFSAATVVVARHGEALANLLFAAPGTRVVELAGADPLQPSPYASIAGLAGLDYVLVAEPSLDADAVRRLVTPGGRP